MTVNDSTAVFSHRITERQNIAVLGVWSVDTYFSVL